MEPQSMERSTPPTQVRVLRLLGTKPPAGEESVADGREDSRYAALTRHDFRLPEEEPPPLPPGSPRGWSRRTGSALVQLVREARRRRRRSRTSGRCLLRSTQPAIRQKDPRPHRIFLRERRRQRLQIRQGGLAARRSSAARAFFARADNAAVGALAAPRSSNGLQQLS